MKKIFLALTGLSLLAACNNDSKLVAGASDSAAAKSSLPMDSVSMMKRWNEAMTPGKEHAFMAKMDGRWIGKNSWWAAPGAPVNNSMDTMTAVMTLGGRLQQSTHTGTMMGMPFNGVGTMAFDNITKKFVSTWADNMGTGLMVQEGTSTDSLKTLEMKGMMSDCNTWKQQTIRTIYHYPDSAHFTMEMYGPDSAGKEFKFMQIEYSKM